MDVSKNATVRCVGFNGMDVNSSARVSIGEVLSERTELSPEIFNAIREWAIKQSATEATAQPETVEVIETNVSESKVAELEVDTRTDAQKTKAAKKAAKRARHKQNRKNAAVAAGESKVTNEEKREELKAILKENRFHLRKGHIRTTAGQPISEVNRLRMSNSVNKLTAALGDLFDALEVSTESLSALAESLGK